MTSYEPTIAGSTLVLSSFRRKQPVLTSGPGEWTRELGALRAAGFSAIDLVDSWLSPALLARDRLAGLREAIEQAELALAGVSVIRRSVIDPVDGEANLEFTLRSLEASATLGAPVVSIGFHRPLLPEQKAAQFWMVPGPTDERDAANWELAIERVGRVATRAGELGLELSLELHEGTLLDSPAGAVRVIEGVGATNVGINPDLGNLLRVPEPLTTGWEQLLRDSLPHMNYWHVKNYLRLEQPRSGTFLSYPTELAFGIIDYRAAVQLALEANYRGPICIEHYEGDALRAIARGRCYLEEVVRELEGTLA